MKFYIIQSGSKGNATIIENNGRILLIDMGIPFNCLKCELDKLNKNIYNLEGLLLTHEHSDHTKGVQYLPPLNIYTLKGTYDAENVYEITSYKPFSLIDLKITPVSTSHDVVNPTGFILENENEKLVYITDTGKLTKKTLNKIGNADYYIFESNHDVQMLLDTSRPYLLKKRILSDKGHLSNEQSANYLVKLIGPNTKQIVLAHLSEEANTPELALKTHKTIYKQNKIKISKIKILCANQHHTVEGGSL